MEVLLHVSMTTVGFVASAPGAGDDEAISSSSSRSLFLLELLPRFLLPALMLGRNGELSQEIRQHTCSMQDRRPYLILPKDRQTYRKSFARIGLRGS